MKSHKNRARRSRRSQRGQTTTEYLMVISVLTISILFSAQASLALFGSAMDQLTSSLSTSLTQDGIRF